ncbi:MAG TPA: CotH kinase family protein [Cyclobacteriaceae bacterium]|nr:CotH kinase family protein [Cyclobacteriaceae bacterium]
MKTVKLILLSLAILACVENNYGQTESATFPEIKIWISKSQYSNLQGKGQRVTLKNPVFLFNKDTAAVKEVHSRGNNSLTFEHKSLSVELDKAITLHGGEGKTKIKKFDLLNLVMDKNLWHNRWAFIAMSRNGLFPLFNTFCTLWINDQPQGIYLLVEKPQHYTASIKSPYMVRRGVDHQIHNEYIETESKEEIKKYKKQYTSLYSDIEKFKDKELYDQMKNKIFLEHYFEWLAFNYLIMNGDYADEVFLYIRPETGLFDVIPWDYDDILLPAPHEGIATRNAVQGLRNKLIFSSEEALDRSIAMNEFLYQQYLGIFKKMLLDLTPEVIEKITNQVADELMRVSADATQANASLFLGKDAFRQDQAKESIRVALSFLTGRRNALLKQME